MTRRADTATSFLDNLRSLYDDDGPFATLYLPVPPPSENADRHVDLEWKQARSSMEEAGAPDDVLEELDGVVGNRDRGGGTLCAVTNGRGATCVITMHVAMTRAIGVWGPLPRLVPLLAWQQSTVPHVVVVTDRTGADITAVSLDRVEHSEQVDGDTLHVQRSAPGGWSQRRFQQRAENQWEDNAREVAEEIAAVADDVGAELIVLAGDVRAKQFLTKHLPATWADRVREVDGGRDDWSLESITDESVRLEASVAAELTVAVLDRFGDAQGNGLATTDVDETLAALNERRVDTLLVVDDSETIDEPESDAAAVGTDDPAMISTDESEVTATGQEAEEAPLADAAIHAALSGGSTVRIVPAHAVPARLGAILRFSTDEDTT
jgi:hypothetical protein